MFFFFNDTATTEIYTLSLHDALPISPSDQLRLPLRRRDQRRLQGVRETGDRPRLRAAARFRPDDLYLHDRSRRSEEHTSELQSRQYLVCRLLLEKKKTNPPMTTKAAP